MLIFNWFLSKRTEIFAQSCPNYCYLSSKFECNTVKSSSNHSLMAEINFFISEVNRLLEDRRHSNYQPVIHKEKSLKLEPSPLLITSLLTWKSTKIDPKNAQAIATNNMGIRVGSIGRYFIVLLTQCRHMNPDEL